MTNLQIVVPAELLAQQSSITETLADIANEQAKLSAQQQEAEAAQLRIAIVIAYLKGEPIPQAKTTKTGRAPMSEIARANIKAGLQKAHATKAALKAAAVLETTQEPPVAVPATVAPAAAKKAAKAK